MMKFRFFLSLLFVAVLLAACSAATSTPAPTQPAGNSATLVVPSATMTAETAAATMALTETLGSTPIPVVTSRGPHLEATDPKTVNMASGGLQFVEFFEFW